MRYCNRNIEQICNRSVCFYINVLKRYSGWYNDYNNLEVVIIVKTVISKYLHQLE